MGGLENGLSHKVCDFFNYCVSHYDDGCIRCIDQAWGYNTPVLFIQHNKKVEKMEEQERASLPVRIISYLIAWTLVGLLILALAQPLMGCNGSAESSSSPALVLVIILSTIGLVMLVGAICLFYSAWKDKKR